MRIFVLGAGGTGSLLAHLLTRQGHTVWCGDRDLTRAQRFLGKKSTIEIVETNARNLWSIVRAARGANLIVNASPAVFNEIVLRAALRLGIHYMDLNAHLTPLALQTRAVSLSQALRREESHSADLRRCCPGAYESARKTGQRTAR